jgi:hypothetical protein
MRLSLVPHERLERGETAHERSRGLHVHHDRRARILLGDLVVATPCKRAV